MGAQIHIRLISDRYDEKQLAPFLGNDFHYEITSGAIWEDKEPFLSVEEAALLEAPYDELFENGTPPPIDPKNLENVFIKVKDYLEKNQETLPFEIDIDRERMDEEHLLYYLSINGARCWVQGDSRYYEVTDKVKIVNLPIESTKVDLWIDIREKLELDGKVYYLRKESRYHKYKESIDGVIAFCRYASQIGEQVYWIYSH